jgi:RNA polymerase sigma factor (sigma-70 family)
MTTIGTAVEPEDERVLADSLANPEAFGLLFERHCDLVYRYIAAQAGAEIAEEVLSETFAAAFAARDRFRGDAPVRAWLLGIATNRMHRHWRADRRGWAALRRLTELDRMRAVPCPPGDQIADTSVIARALAQLSTRERDALLLQAWGGLTYAEIAAVLDVPIGTVRSRISRARKALTRVLEES